MQDTLTTKVFAFIERTRGEKISRRIQKRLINGFMQEHGEITEENLKRFHIYCWEGYKSINLEAKNIIRRHDIPGRAELFLTGPYCECHKRQRRLFIFVTDTIPLTVNDLMSHPFKPIVRIDWLNACQRWNKMFPYEQIKEDTLKAEYYRIKRNDYIVDEGINSLIDSIHQIASGVRTAVILNLYTVMLREDKEDDLSIDTTAKISDQGAAYLAARYSDAHIVNTIALREEDEDTRCQNMTASTLFNDYKTTNELMKEFVDGNSTTQSLVFNLGDIASRQGITYKLFHSSTQILLREVDNIIATHPSSNDQQPPSDRSRAVSPH